MKIWTLVVGTYSAMQTAGAYSSEQEAKQAAELVDGFVEGPFSLDELRFPAPDLPCFHFDITKDGKATIKEVAKLSDGIFEEGDLGELRKEEYCLVKGGDEGEGRYEPKWYWRIRGYIYAKDEETVAKIVNEIRVRVIAGSLPNHGPIRTEN